MMMSYLRNNNRPKTIFSRRIKLVLGLLGGLVVIYFLRGTVVGESLREGSIFAARPWWWLGKQISTISSSWKNFFASREFVVNQTRQLQLAEQKLINLTLENQLLKIDNDLYRQSLQRAPGAGLVGTGAVLASNKLAADLLLIDLGSAVGSVPQIGDLAAAQDGIVVLGKVVAVDKRTSTIRLFSLPGSETLVYLGATSTSALARGIGGGNFIIDLPRGVPAAVGDEITYQFPGQQFLIGKITEIDRLSSDAFQKITFRYPINLSNLRLVQIYHYGGAN